MKKLDSHDRSFLTKKAHKLKPVVYVGKNGLTEEVLAAIVEALEIHELIKIKFVDFKGERREISHTIAEETKSQIVRVIGNIAIVFKYQHNPEKRKINLKGK